MRFHTRLKKNFAKCSMCTHYAVTGYTCVCTTCILSASATIQVVHTQEHPLNSSQQSKENLKLFGKMRNNDFQEMQYLSHFLALCKIVKSGKN